MKCLNLFRLLIFFSFQNVVCLIFWFESRTTEAIVDQLPFEKGHFSIHKQQTPRSDCAMSTQFVQAFFVNIFYCIHYMYAGNKDPDCTARMHRPIRTFVSYIRGQGFVLRFSAIFCKYFDFLFAFLFCKRDLLI